MKKKNGISGILFAGVIFLSLLLCGCKESDKTYEKGLSLYLSGDYAAAASSFELAISQGETNGLIFADLALCYQQLEEPEKALELIQKAELLSGNESKAKSRIGMFWLLKKDYEKAERYFRDASESTPSKEEKREAKAGLANVYFETERYEEAIEIFNSLILDGYYIADHQLRAGECYLKLNQKKAASQYFDLVMENSSSDWKTGLFLYQLCYQHEDFENAEKYLEKGFGRLDSSVSQGAYYYYAGKYIAAEKYLKDEESEASKLLYASLLTEREEYDQAERIYREILETKEGSPELYNQYYMVAILKKDFTLANQLFSYLDGQMSSEEEEAVNWNRIIQMEKEGKFREAYNMLLEYRKKYPYSAEIESELLVLSRLW